MPSSKEVCNVLAEDADVRAVRKSRKGGGVFRLQRGSRHFLTAEVGVVVIEAARKRGSTRELGTRC